MFFHENDDHPMDLGVHYVQTKPLINMEKADSVMQVLWLSSYWHCQSVGTTNAESETSIEEVIVALIHIVLSAFQSI